MKVIALIILVSLAALAQPAVSVTPKTGPPGDNVAIAGLGFAASEALNIFFDTARVALATTDSSGAFRGIHLTVPAAATPGQHWITATGRQAGQAAQVSFTVQADWPAFMRGPEHNAYNAAENVLNTSNVGSFVLRWSVPTLGQIYGSPVIANGLVYVGSGNKELYAFDAETGSQVWLAGGGQKMLALRSYSSRNDFSVSPPDCLNQSNSWTPARATRSKNMSVCQFGCSRVV